MRIYIASPYSNGNKMNNVLKSLEVAEAIRAMGFLPHPPLLSHYWDLYYPHDYDYWMAMCLEELSYCDAIFRITGESKGADMEVTKAKELGLPVYYSLEELAHVR